MKVVCGMCILILFLVCLVCIVYLNEKYSKLLTKNFIRDNIYSRELSIFLVLKSGLCVLLGLISIFYLIIFFCKKTL